MHGEEDALYVHVEHLVTRCLRGGDCVAVALDAGRGDERVEPPEALDRRRDGSLARTGVDDVARDGDRATTLVSDLASDAVGLVLDQPVNDDGRSVRREPVSGAR